MAAFRTAYPSLDYVSIAHRRELFKKITELQNKLGGLLRFLDVGLTENEMVRG